MCFSNNGFTFKSIDSKAQSPYKQYVSGIWGSVHAPCIFSKGGINLSHHYVILSDQAKIINNISKEQVSAVNIYGNGKLIITSSAVKITNNKVENTNKPAVKFTFHDKNAGKLFLTDSNIKLTDVIHSNTNKENKNKNHCTPKKRSKDIEVSTDKVSLIEILNNKGAIEIVDGKQFHKGTYYNLICK